MTCTGKALGDIITTCQCCLYGQIHSSISIHYISDKTVVMSNAIIFQTVTVIVTVLPRYKMKEKKFQYVFITARKWKKRQD